MSKYRYSNFKILGKVVSNQLIENQNLMPCQKDEGEDCVFIYVKDFSRLESRKITVVALYIDVKVISLYAFSDTYPILEELWIEFN